MNNPTTKGTNMTKFIVLAILTSLSMSAIAAPKAITPGPDQKEILSVVKNTLNTVYACRSVKSLIVTVADAAPYVDARGCSIISTNTLVYEAWPQMPVSVHVEFKKGPSINAACDFYANTYDTDLPGTSTILDCRTP